jgi:phage terminase small subunit
MEARARRVEISGDNVLRGIAQLAFYDPRKLFNSDSSPKQITELDDETAMAISGLECIELFEGTGDQRHCYGILKKIKLADGGQNLERLGRHLKLFTDKVEHGLDDETARASSAHA